MELRKENFGNAMPSHVTERAKGAIKEVLELLQGKGLTVEEVKWVFYYGNDEFERTVQEAKF